MGDHQPSYIVSVVITVVLYVITVVLCRLAFQGKQGVFRHSTSDIFTQYTVDTTPSHDNFTSWLVIYLLQLLWLGYGLSTLFRRSSRGPPLYLSPAYMPMEIYVLYCLGLALNAGWFFLWDRLMFTESFAMMAGSALCLYGCVGVSLRGLAKHGPELLAERRKWDPRLVRNFVQNMIALYAGWINIVAVLNLSIILKYKANVTEPTASTVSLVILLVELLVWAGLDIIMLDKYTRFLFAPYIRLLWACLFMLHSGTTHSQNHILKITTLALVSLVIFVKSVLMTINLCKGIDQGMEPLWRESTPEERSPLLAPVRENMESDGARIQHSIN